MAFGYSDNNVITRQVNSYYPFGMNIKGLTANSVSTKTAYPNEYLYNGKLMQDEMNLGWLDYGRRMYDLQLGRWHSVDLMAEKCINISQFAYTANNPVIFVDKDGKEIYIITQNKNVVSGVKVIQQTSVGKQLWDKYGRNDSHDIYISAQSFTENNAGGLAYAYANKQGMIQNGKVDMAQFYSVAPYTKDFSSFNGIDVSQSKGKNIHLISMNKNQLGDEMV